MSNPAVKVTIPPPMIGPAKECAADNGIKLQDLMRMTLARYLSKEGYYLTGGRGWRSKRKETRGRAENPAKDHAQRSMVPGLTSETTQPEGRP